MGSSEQHYSLRWNDYTVKIVTAFQSLRDEEDFVDVTVACDGHHYSAHKMVLSACSPYFRSLLRANPCQHPIVILKDVGHLEMERLLEFMYNGEVNIAQDHLAAFLKTAETLKIRGLAGSSEEMDQIHRDGVHSFTGCYSGVTSNSGLTSGRNSPTVCFAPLTDKDDDITDTSFTSGSPSYKRRKGSLCVSLPTENSTSQTETLASESLLEGADRAGNPTGNGGLDLDEDPNRDDRRELKSEPSDHLALPGPSGTTADGLLTHHTGAAPEGAVCEALNLSLRSTPATNQVNGSSSFPPPLSIHQQCNIQHSNYEHQQVSMMNLSPALKLIPCQQIKIEKEDFKFESLATPIEIGEGSSSDIHRYSDIAMDLICNSDSLNVSQMENHMPMTASTSSPLSQSSAVNNSNISSEFKTKIYPCPECHKVFRHPMSLHHHRHVHKGTYTCHSCGKVFSRRWDLHRHIHRSKMGCRRANNAVPMGAAQSLNSTPHLDHPYDLNNPPSN